ncbi:hypothetical protein MUG91_G11n93 [Manis pentadactyla]|nr:hypothetical protein MUG91_G11n93 [Manis pentadactyla]
MSEPSPAPTSSVWECSEAEIGQKRSKAREGVCCAPVLGTACSVLQEVASDPGWNTGLQRQICSRELHFGVPGSERSRAGELKGVLIRICELQTPCQSIAFLAISIAHELQLSVQLPKRNLQKCTPLIKHIIRSGLQFSSAGKLGLDEYRGEEN